MKNQKTIEVICCDICGLEITNRNYSPRLKSEEKDLCQGCNQKVYKETEKLFNDKKLFDEAFEIVKKRFPLEQLKK